MEGRSFPAQDLQNMKAHPPVHTTQSHRSLQQRTSSHQITFQDCPRLYLSVEHARRTMSMIGLSLHMTTVWDLTHINLQHSLNRTPHSYRCYVEFAHQCRTFHISTTIFLLKRRLNPLSHLISALNALFKLSYAHDYRAHNWLNRALHIVANEQELSKCGPVLSVFLPLYLAACSQMSSDNCLLC